MRTMQSFLIFFYVLDQCYEQCHEDDLGGFLGAISPEIWEDGQPMDRAVFTDWQEMCNSSTGVNEQNVTEKAYDFLDYYEKQYGFNFTKTKQWLITLNNPEVFENAVIKAQILYDKFRLVN